MMSVAKKILTVFLDDSRASRCLFRFKLFLKRRVLKPMLFFFVSMLVFSFVYNGLWLFKPDSFVIKEGLGFEPTVLMYDYDLGLEEVEDPLVSLYSLSQRLKAYKDDLNALDEKITERSARLDDIDVAYERLMDEVDQQRDNAIEEYVNQELKNHEENLSEAEKSFERLSLDGHGLNDNASQDDLIRYYEAEQEVHQSRIDLYQAEIEVKEYVVDNISGFVNPEDADRLSQLQAESGNIKNEIVGLGIKKREVYLEALDLIRGWAGERRDAVKFLDFLYFSAGIATTTTLGNLSANSITARTIVVFQLLISFVLVTVFLSDCRKPGLGNN